MLKKIKSSILSTLICFLAFGYTSQIHACDSNETKKYSDTELCYNLDSINDLSYTTSNDGMTSIKIEKEPAFYTLKNGRYKISTTRKGSWNACFYIDISNYRITTAGNASAQAIVGSFVYKKLKINDYSTATYYLTRKIGLALYKIDFKARIENHNLKVIVN